MLITWYGQASFRLESKEVRVLIDPFDKKTGLKPPRINDTIVLVTHDHHDHNAVGDTESQTLLITGPGEYEKSGVQIVGINSFHDNEQGATRGLNTIYVVKLEDITLCHLGDLGQSALTAEQVEIIGNVDILMIPIGGTYTIDGKQAMSIIKQIEPKIIIPMHYKVPGLTIDLEGPQVFLKEIGIKPEEQGESYRIVAKALPTEEMKLITFNL